MAQTIKLKNSGTSGNTPSSLVHGELALNYADGKLFYKNSSNSIVELSTGGGSGSFLPLSGGTLTGTLTVSSTSANAIKIDGNTGGLNFTGGNNRIYFGGQRALEGVTSSGNIQIGEGFSGNLLLQMATEVQGQLSVTDGSVGAPSIRFSNDTNTGIYRGGDDNFIIATGGANRVTVTSAGIFSSANLYSGTTGSYRNFAGTWAGTTGTANNGFYFLNTANSNTTKAMDLSHDGNVVFAGEVEASSLDINGVADIAGDTVITGSSGSGNALKVSRGDGGGQGLRVHNTGEVVVPTNYLYAARSSGSAFYAQASAVFRGGITNDGGNTLSISSGSSDINFNNKNLVSVGAITANADDNALTIKSPTNATGVEIKFSDNTSGNQNGFIEYRHSDGHSYGGSDVFTIKSDQTALRVLADGLLMFKSGLAVKPATGTGAGTTIITSGRAIQNITSISCSGEITASDLTITGGTSSQDIYINNTSPTLGFTDSNSFSDSNDVYLIRGASTGKLQFQFKDDSAGTTTQTFLIDQSGNTDIAGNTEISGTLTVSTAGSSIKSPLYMGVQNSTGEGGEITLSGSNSNTGHTLDTVNGSFRIFDNNGTLLSGNSGYGLSVVNGYRVNGTQVITSSRNLTNIGTISSGAITSSGQILTTIESSTAIKSRFIMGKASGSTANGNLYLQYGSSDTVFIGAGSGGAGLDIAGTLKTGRTGINTASVSDVQLKIKTSTNDSTDFAIEAQSANGNSLFSLDGAGEVRLAGNVKMSGTTIITSGRGLTNLTLSHGTGGTRFETNNWHYSTDNHNRFYFEATGRTFYKATTHQFRNVGSNTVFNINSTGGIHIASGGDSNASSTEYIKAGGVAILTNARVLQNVSGDISMFTNDSNYATQTYVTNAISNLVDSAPSTLDTLNELASALNDDANFSTTVTNSIATKLPLAGGTLTGTLNSKAINMQNHQLYGVNNLRFNDPGVQEGIKWDGGNEWQIYESPDNQTNAAGNLQFASGSSNGTLKATLTTTGAFTTRQANGTTRIGQDGNYGNYGSLGFGGHTNGSNRIFGHYSTGDGLYLASATGRGVFIRTNGGNANNFEFTSGGDLKVAGSTFVTSGKEIQNASVAASSSIAPRFRGTASVNNSGYVHAFRVDGDNLASSIRFTVHGTTGSVVVNSDIFVSVNHYHDIFIESNSGFYTVLTVKVVSNGNEDFSVYLKTNSANTATVQIEVYPLNNETITFTSTDQGFTTKTLEHTCDYGKRLSAEDNVSGRGFDIETDGQIDALKYQISGTTVIGADRSLTSINSITSGGNINTTSGGFQINGATVINSSRHINLFTSGSTGTEQINLARGGRITFYGDTNAKHSIGSRDLNGAISDDIRINTYGGLSINLDSNDNNAGNANFTIGRHGGGSSTISELMTVSGETGAINTNSTITAGSTIHRGNMTIDSQEIDVGSGDLTVDVAGNLTLDAGGGSIDLKEGGTTFGRLQEMIGGLGISAGSSPTFAQLLSSTKTLFFGHIELGDDKHVRWGNGNGDLQIYHDGLNSYIEEYGTGDLIISSSVLRPRTDSFILNNAANTEHLITASEGSSVFLYHDGAERFRTHSYGGSLTGSLAVSTQVWSGGSQTHTAPAYAFNNDTNTGMFRVSSDVLGFSTGGTERFRADSGGVIVTNGNFAVLKGNTSNTFTNPQIRFGYAGSQSYQQSIRTRHNAGTGTGNAIDFFLWDSGTDAVGTLGTKRVASFETSRGLNITHGGLQIDSTDVINSGRVLSNVTGNVSMFTNDAGYLTSATLGSNLNADTVDSLHASSFLRSDANDSASGTITFSTAQGIRLSHGNQVNTDDGRIAAATHGSGLNIVGTQTTSGLGRQVRIFGSLINNSNDSTYWHASNDGSGSGLDADTLDGYQSGYFATQGNLGNYLPLSGGTMTGTITSRDLLLQSGYHLMRSNHHSGHLEGSYNNVGGNAVKSNPIYTIGSNYNPLEASLQNMYGIGFAKNSASYMTGDLDAGNNNGWGLYVAADGDARVFLNGSHGIISSTGQHYADGQLVWNAGNDGAGSGLDADTLDGAGSGSFLRSDANDTMNNTLTFSSSAGFDLATHDVYGSMRVIRNNKSGSDGMYIGYLNTNSGLTRIFGGGQGSGGIYVTGSGANDIKYNNSSTFWHAGNDGSGSGLDADLLDGYDSAENGASKILRTQSNGYLNILNWINVGSTGLFSNSGNHFHVETNGWISKSANATNSWIRLRTNDNNTRGFVYASSSSYIGFLDPSQNWLFQARSNGNLYKGNGTGLIWHAANDGSGSGLDADTVDSLHASSFLRSDASDTYTSGTLTFGSGTGFDLATFDIYGSMRVIRNNKSGSDGMYIGYLNANSGHTRIFGGGQGSGGIRVNGSGNNDIKMGTSSGTAWHSANDGSGSGLDADLLDGINSSSFLRSDTDDTFTGNSLGFPTLGLYITNNNTAPGSHYIRGNSTHIVHGTASGNTFYLNYGNSSGSLLLYGSVYHANAIVGTKLWGNSNDGSGSGLDADTVDGVHASSLYGVTSVATGGGLTGGTITSTGTISHADTSSVSNVNNSGNTFIQDITFDTYGHVTSVTSATATSSGGGGASSSQTVTARVKANRLDYIAATSPATIFTATSGKVIVLEEAICFIDADAVSASGYPVFGYPIRVRVKSQWNNSSDAYIHRDGGMTFTKEALNSLFRSNSQSANYSANMKRFLVAQPRDPTAPNPDMQQQIAEVNSSDGTFNSKIELTMDSYVNTSTSEDYYFYFQVKFREVTLSDITGASGMVTI